jgi:hypothetical protein
VFTQLAFLSVHATSSGSHPTKRGTVVWRDLLCGALGKLPDNVPSVKEAGTNVSTRERFAMHDESPCAVCHKFIEGVGFAFENYDAAGKWRTTDGGKPVDATGKVNLPSGQEVTFTNAVELMKKVATTEDVRTCMARQWFRYGLGRGEVDADESAITRTSATLGQSGDLRDVLYSIITAKTFVLRTADDGEVL